MHVDIYMKFLLRYKKLCISTCIFVFIYVNNYKHIHI